MIFQGCSSSTLKLLYSHGRGLVSHADNESLASIRLSYKPKEGAAEELLVEQEDALRCSLSPTSCSLSRVECFCESFKESKNEALRQNCCHLFSVTSVANVDIFRPKKRVNTAPLNRKGLTQRQP